MPETVIRTLLAADATLTGIASTRIRESYADEEDELPYVVFERDGTRLGDTFQGSDGLAGAEMKIGCYSHAASQAWAMAEAVRLALHGYSGTVGSVVVQGITMEAGDIDSVYFQAPDSSQRGIQLVELNVVVWHEVDIPS